MLTTYPEREIVRRNPGKRIVPIRKVTHVVYGIDPESGLPVKLARKSKDAALRLARTLKDPFITEV